MNTMNEWKLTIIGGSENGRQGAFSSDVPIVVGRSRSANFQLSKSYGDVSGRHAEFFIHEGVAYVRNLSQTQAILVNGRKLSNSETLNIDVGDTVSIGVQAVVRVDSIPLIGRFNETQGSLLDDTVATKVISSNDSIAEMQTAVLEESANDLRNCGISSIEGTTGGTFATKIPDAFSGLSSSRATDTVATRFADIRESTDGIALETTSTRFRDSSEATVTEWGDSASKEDQTMELHTINGSQEMIEQIKRELERKKKIRRSLVMFAVLFVTAVLATIYVLSGGMSVEAGMAWPKKSDGTDDVRTFAIRDDAGDILLKVDYPGHPNISETISPDNKGISVVSWYGKERDVPYFLQFESWAHPEELEIDLMTSVNKWFAKTTESGEGYVFDERMRDTLAPKFFEDSYPGSCEQKTLYGVKFLEFEYKRSWPDGKLWHGWAHYFRSGDTVYLLRREIPEFYWERGGYRIKADPNIAVYKTYSDAYWEATGKEKAIMHISTSVLMDEISDALARERAADWGYARRNIDAVLSRSWRTDNKTKELALSCLRKYREILRVYYYGKYNAFLAAKDNREEKKMQRIRSDAQIVFQETEERYSILVNNGEVW